MKSNKQRRKEIKQKRQDKRYAKAQALRLERVRSTVGIDVYTMPDTLPEHAILADHDELIHNNTYGCLLYTSPSPRDRQKSRMPSSA